MRANSLICFVIIGLFIVLGGRVSAQFDFGEYKVPLDHVYNSIEVGVSFGPVVKRVPFGSGVILFRRFGLITSLEDPWFATKDSGAGLQMREFSNPNNYDELFGMLRSDYFHAKDSVMCGGELESHFTLDTSDHLDRDLSIAFSYQLMDSASGTPIATLKEYTLVRSTTPYRTRGFRIVDIPPGTYYLQLSIGRDILQDDVDFIRDTVRPSITIGTSIADSSQRYYFIVDWSRSGSETDVPHFNEWNTYLSVGSLSLSPNPATSGTTILTFDARTAGEYLIDVTDLLGRTLISLNVISRESPSEVDIPLDLSRLAQGAYHITVRSLDRAGRSRATLLVR